MRSVYPLAMEYVFHPQCFLDLSRNDFELALQDASRRKWLEQQCALLQQTEQQQRAKGRSPGHAVVFRSGGLCWGWLDIKDALEEALKKTP